MHTGKKDQTISVSVTREMKEKALYLARQDQRSLPGQVRHLLKIQIRDYEQLHGPIQVPPRSS